MKKVLTMLFNAVIALTMTSCADDITIDQPINKKPSITILVNQSKATTRADYSGIGVSVTEVSISEGDVIGVYAVDNKGNIVSDNVAFTYDGKAWGTATDVPYDKSYSYYAYYPHVENPYKPDFSKKTTNEIFAQFISDADNKFHSDDQSTKKKFTACDLMVSELGVLSDKTTVSFSLYHKKGLAVFTGSGACFTDKTFVNGNKAYFMIKTSTPTEVAGYTFSIDAGKYSVQDVSIESIEAKIEIKDLSMYNNAGKLQSTRNTANCYMIHQAGIYKIPLVYGNAIKNDITNEKAYYNKNAKTPNRLVNHANVGIIDPWLKNNGVNVDGTELVWEDSKGLVGKITQSGDYLYVSIPNDATSKPGNAVIAAKSGNTIVWSWHLWITPETLTNLTKIYTGRYEYQLAPVNVGWIEDGTQTVGGGHCPYYQWGRKDAMMPSIGAFDASGNTIPPYSSNNGTCLSNYSATIGDYIQNPDKFFRYTLNRPEKLYGGTYWDMNYKGDESFNVITCKTIYDPCPPGFSVPSGHLYDYLYNNKSYVSGGNNYYMLPVDNKDINFPKCGFLYGYDGSLREVNKTSSYWTAAECSYYNHIYSYNLYFSDITSDIGMVTRNRATGCPVMAVKQSN